MSARKFTDDQLIALHTEGLTDREAGERLGVRAKNVGAGRKRLGLASNFDPNAPRPNRASPKPKPKPKPASQLRVEGSGKRSRKPRPSPVVPTDTERLHKFRCGLIDAAYAAGVKKAMARMEGNDG